VRKGERELRCVAVYLPNGIDVKLFEGEDFRRTLLVRDSFAVAGLSHEWKQALMTRN
jgi:hypothetical protein